MVSVGLLFLCCLLLGYSVYISFLRVYPLANKDVVLILSHTFLFLFFLFCIMHVGWLTTTNNKQPNRHMAAGQRLSANKQTKGQSGRQYHFQPQGTES